MLAWLPRPFASWREFAEYLVFLSTCVAGVANAAWLWPLIGAMVLLLLGWSRYRDLFAKAGSIDAEYRDLGALAARHGLLGAAIALYARARTLLIVLGVKIGHDALFTGGGTCSQLGRPNLAGPHHGALKRLRTEARARQTQNRSHELRGNDRCPNGRRRRPSGQGGSVARLALPRDRA
jgi:hypothetical protein